MLNIHNEKNHVQDITEQDDPLFETRKLMIRIFTEHDGLLHSAPPGDGNCS